MPVLLYALQYIFGINIRLHRLYAQLCCVLVPISNSNGIHSEFWLRHRFMRSCAVFILIPIRPISFVRSTSIESPCRRPHTLIHFTYHVSISWPQHNCLHHTHGIRLPVSLSRVSLHFGVCICTTVRHRHTQLRESTRANVCTPTTTKNEEEKKTHGIREFKWRPSNRKCSVSIESPFRLGRYFTHDKNNKTSFYFKSKKKDLKVCVHRLNHCKI